LKGESGERWLKLCEQAAVEEDSQKLLELIAEINRLLGDKEHRLLNRAQEPEDTTKQNVA
jgi:hypothetical protein